MVAYMSRQRRYKERIDSAQVPKAGKPFWTLGVLGGMGPATSCDFTKELIKDYESRNQLQQPNVALVNIRESPQHRNKLMRGEFSPEFFQILCQGMDQLEACMSDVIVIPCNSVHFYLERLRARTKTRVLSIMEECASYAARKGYRKVGILATPITLKHGIYSDKLAAQKIALVTPTRQERINAVLENIFVDKFTAEDRQVMQEAILEMKAAGAEAVILGCTDISHYLFPKDSALPLLDTFAIVRDAALEHLMKPLPNGTR